MGRDKSQLPFRDTTLSEYVARVVEDAAGSATLVGNDPSGRRRAIPDLYPGIGPVGGIATALDDTPAQWNLIVACDMPALHPEPLRMLLRTAVDRGQQALVPATADGRVHPLCAVYAKSALPVLQQAVAGGIQTVREVLRRLTTIYLEVGEAQWLANANTPEEWAVFEGQD